MASATATIDLGRSTILESSLRGVPPSASYDKHGPYVGSTLEGLRNGRGKYQFANAFYQYQGDWVDGVMHGRGTMNMADGGMYEGDFDRGAMDGVGMRKWGDGATYSGEFAAGEMHGGGTYIAATGEQYQGEFVRNRRQGTGQLTTSTGDVYDGQFAAHKMSGQGTMDYLGVGRYEGQWDASQRSGQGTMTWDADVEVDVYEGSWAADTAHGAGRFARRAVGGYEREGEWVEGVASSIATVMALAPWVPPAGPLELSGLSVRRPVDQVPSVPSAGAEEGAEGEPPLLLVLTVLDADEGVEGRTAELALEVVPTPSTLPAAEVDDMLESAVEEALAYVTYAPLSTANGQTSIAALLSLPEGVARPLRLGAELRAGETLIGSAEMALAEDGLASTVGFGAVLTGTMTDAPLTLPTEEAPPEGEPPTAMALLTFGYAAADEPTKLDPALMVSEINTEESLAALLEAPMDAASLIPPLACLCLRQTQREPTEEEVAAYEEKLAEEAAAKAKAKKGKDDPEPEPEPLGNVTEHYAVINESGRRVEALLRLPADVAAVLVEGAAAAAEEALVAYEAAEAAKVDEAVAAGVAAPPAEAAPVAPPPPTTEWILGDAPSVAGRVLLRGFAVPDDVPTGPAELILRETTRQPSLFELPPMVEVLVPLNLIAMPDPEAEEPEPPPPPKKGK